MDNRVVPGLWSVQTIFQLLLWTFASFPSSSPVLRSHVSSGTTGIDYVVKKQKSFKIEELGPNLSFSDARLRVMNKTLSLRTSFLLSKINKLKHFCQAPVWLLV